MAKIEIMEVEKFFSDFEKREKKSREKESRKIIKRQMSSLF